MITKNRSKNILLLLYISLALVPLIITPFFRDYYFFAKIFVIYLFVVVMYIFHIKNENRIRIINDSLVIILILYLFTIMIATCFSTNIMKSIQGSAFRKEGLVAILAYGLLFIISKLYFKHSEKYLNLIIISSVLISIYGISQYFGFDILPKELIKINFSKRAFATMGNPNFLGSYLVVLLPISAFSYLKKGTIYSLLASSLVYLCLLLTFTRSALLGFIVILVFLTVYALQKKTVWKSFVILIIVFALIAVLVDLHSSGRLFGRFISIANDAKILISKSEGYENTGANRGFIWVRTIELIKEKPLFGYGLENLGDVFTNKYQYEIIENFGKMYTFDKAHNEYLHIAVTTGIPSLILYLVFICLSVLKGIKHLKVNLEYMPYMAAVMGYLAQAFFNISVVSVAFILWIFLGALTNEHLFESSEITRE